MALLLRGGYATEDPRLDRIPQFDEKSRAYPISAVVPEKIKSKVWRLPRSFYGDQGREGACVEFGFTHELGSHPVAVKLRILRRIRAEHLIYHRAQQQDPWEGGSYPGASPQYEGTSVLAGAQVAQSMGFFKSYRWAFSIDEGIRGISNEGPSVIALDWDEGLSMPLPSGLAVPSGRVLGGHCVAWIGVMLNHRLRGDSQRRNLAVIAQSWGLDHGDRGRIYVPLEDLERKLMDNGEQCFPMERAQSGGGI